MRYPTLANARPEVSDCARYSPGEAMRLLGMSRTTFYRRAAAGNLQCTTAPDGRRYYRGRDLLRFWQCFTCPTR